MSTRTEFDERYRPYWEAPTSKVGLRKYRLSQTSETERECRNCEEVFDIEDFWTGTTLSFYCDRCRPKRKKHRQQMEKQISDANKTKRQQKKDDKSSGGPLKKMAGKAAGKLAGKVIESAISK